MQSFWTSLSGMSASQKWLDTIGDNLANENTPGFAAGQTSFQDTLTRVLSPTATGGQTAGRLTPPGWWGGSGVMGTQIERDFSTMPLQQTGVSTDLAINGPGFFMVQNPTGGSPLLTKAGDFSWAKMANGSFALATPDGNPVLDSQGKPIEITTTSAGAQTAPLAVAKDGTVTVAGKALGQKLAIAEVGSPSDDLQAAGENNFTANPGINVRVINAARPGVGTTGGTGVSSTIEQGLLSQSNVDVSKAMIDMVQAQRMFDLNAEAEQMTTHMEQTSNNIHT